MGLFKTTPKAAPRTLRALARLVGYPGAELRANLPLLRDALHAEAALPASRLAELDALLAQLARSDPLDVEADYVQLFDSGRKTSLHLFEHVHGDSRDRGPAMIDLAQTYEKAGLYLAPGELPDYLPVVLEFASTQPAREAAGFLSEIAHLVNAIFAALEQRGSRYASVMGALLDLAGERARAVQLPDDEAFDASWSEPAAFDGCSGGGRSRAEQPVQIVRPRNAQARTGAQA